MTRSSLAVLALALVAACFDSHGGQQAINKDDCGTCHIAEFNATGPTPEFPAAPVHPGSMGCTVKDCAQCHRTTTWANSLGGCDHPETATAAPSTGFPLHSLGTQHTNIKCIDCHSDAITAETGATSHLGANTDCIGCHPNDSSQQQNHVGVLYETGARTGQPYAFLPDDRRFCLDCHPQGLALGHGKNNPFDLPHHHSTCGQCHDNASGLGHQGGADVTCMRGGCHDGNGSDRAHHADTGHHPGCLAQGCHPDGRSHD